MSALRGFCCDDETGEVTFYPINEETGEPYTENVPPTEFPSNYTPIPSERKKYMKFPKGYITKSKKFQSLKASIIAGSNPVSHRLLLFPTIMIYPGIVCIVLMALEVYLHVRCHKKNKKLKSNEVYYRSPFHVLTSKFCGLCKDWDTASRIGQIQDKRRFRHDYSRNVAE